jgi:FtsZ-binding cell division protein ZapB
VPDRPSLHGSESGAILRRLEEKLGQAAGRWRHLKQQFDHLSARHENLKREHRALAGQNEALRRQLAAERATARAVREITWQAAEESARARLGFPARPGVNRWPVMRG